MPTDFKSYADLLARSREISFVDAAAALLNWDEETYMPRAALDFRAGQLAFLSGWSHRQFTAPEVGDWIKACEDHAFDADSDEAVNVRNWRWAYDLHIILRFEVELKLTEGDLKPADIPAFWNEEFAKMLGLKDYLRQKFLAP